MYRGADMYTNTWCAFNQNILLEFPLYHNCGNVNKKRNKIALPNTGKEMHKQLTTPSNTQRYIN